MGLWLDSTSSKCSVKQKIIGSRLYALPFYRALVPHSSLVPSLFLGYSCCISLSLIASLSLSLSLPPLLFLTTGN